MKLDHQETNKQKELCTQQSPPHWCFRGTGTVRPSPLTDGAQKTPTRETPGLLATQEKRNQQALRPNSHFKNTSKETSRFLKTQGRAGQGSSSELLRKGAGPPRGSWTQENTSYRKSQLCSSPLGLNALCRGGR